MEYDEIDMHLPKPGTTELQQPELPGADYWFRNANDLLRLSFAADEINLPT